MSSFCPNQLSQIFSCNTVMEPPRRSTSLYIYSLWPLLPSRKHKVDWRFLAHASDDEPGFSTAWLQQKSLKREADCREREYRNSILAGFANEFGMNSIFPSRRLDPSVDEDDAEGDDAEEEHDHVVRNTESPSISSRTVPGASLPHQDLPILPEVRLHSADCSSLNVEHMPKPPQNSLGTLAVKTHRYRANVQNNLRGTVGFRANIFLAASRSRTT